MKVVAPILLFIFVAFLPSGAVSKTVTVTGSLLTLLDKTIGRRDYYVLSREGRIGELTREANARELPAEERYALNRRFFEQYRSCSFDSATATPASTSNCRAGWMPPS